MMTAEVEKLCYENNFNCGFLFGRKSQLLPLLDFFCLELAQFYILLVLGVRINVMAVKINIVVL